jgi:hypothetical protein
LQVFAVILTGVALLGFWAICREFLLLARLRRNGVRTTGTVTGHLRGSGSVDRPVIEFSDRHGRPVRYSPSWGGQKKFVPLGNQVAVAYLADDPRKARLAGAETRRGSLVLGALVCSVFLALGLLLVTGVLPQSSESPLFSPDADSPMTWLVALAIQVPGVLMIGYGIRRLRSLNALRGDGVAATGTVVQVFGERDEEERRTVVEFPDWNHRRIQVVVSSPSRSVTVGTQVPLVYRPDSPESAQLASSSDASRSLLFGVVLFLATVVAGGFILFS